MWGGNASADSNRLCWSRADMSRLDVKSVQGSLTKEIGFYAERASTHNTPKPKVGARKPSPAIFNPSLFLINPKLAQTSAFDSMTDEFAVVNVKRNGLQHLISPISHCEWDLAGGADGGLYGEKPRPLWWALPGDNEGHAAVLSESTDRRAGGLGRAAGRRLSTHAFTFPLYLYPESRTNRHIYIFTLCQRRDCLIPRCLHSLKEMPRANQVRCLLSVPFTHSELCFENI